MPLSRRHWMPATRLMRHWLHRPSRRPCATGKRSSALPSKREGPMTGSYTQSSTSTFTITHARHMAAKLAADLKRMQRFYGAPSDDSIAAYETEVGDLLQPCLVTLARHYLGTEVAQVVIVVAVPHGCNRA